MGYACLGKCLLNLSWTNHRDTVQDDCSCEYCPGVNAVHLLLSLLGEYSYGDWLKVTSHLSWNRTPTPCNLVKSSLSITHKSARPLPPYPKPVVERTTQCSRHVKDEVDLNLFL